MGWWEALCFRGWPRPEPLASGVLDLTRPEVCGIVLGAATRRLREELGAPASYWAWRRGLWLYPAWGLRFDAPGNEEVEGLSVVLWRPEQAAIAPARVRWHAFQGQVRLPDRRVRASELERGGLERALGPPDRLEEAEGETLLTWRREGWRLEVSLHPEGEPLALGISRE
jgi:hypothetical protein